MSCLGYCGEGANKFRACGCDDTCLYIGDCCYDFLYLCKGEYDLDDALANQEQIMEDLAGKTICTKQYIQRVAAVDEYSTHDIPMIAKCSSNTTEHLLALCVDYKKHIFSILPPVPVIQYGVIYSNVYCSLCNGVPLWEATLLPHKIIDLNHIHSKAIVVIFYDKIPMLDRFIAACSLMCSTHRPYCPLEQSARECRAYKAPVRVVLPDGIQRYFNNMACSHCTNISISEVSCVTRPNCADPWVPKHSMDKWISLFDFVGVHATHEGAMPNCASIRCQQGYILRENGCSYCMKEDTYSSPTSFSWFQPTVLLVFHAENSVKTFRQMYGREVIKNDPNCSHTIHWFRKTGLIGSGAQYDDYQNVCLLLSISFVEVQFYMNVLRSDIVMEQVMPGMRGLLHAALITNFDIRSKADCEGVTIVPTSFDDILQGIYTNSNSKLHNHSQPQHVPWAFVQNFTVSKERVKAWKVLCIENQKDEFNCSRMNTSDFETCPKIEFQFTTTSSEGFIIKHGVILKQHPEEYILINSHTALVCANQCEKFLVDYLKILDILVPICYSVSMTCLLATFLIYAAIPAMRSVPGLMLINLIMALFLAQMSYLISSYGVFLNYPSWCQFLGAAQHHLWLTAFAWMACISADIFQCLGSLQVSRAESYRKQYYKWVASCWVAPAAIPILTIGLQFSGWVNVGYGGKQSCWLINHRSVLYLFAIPALSIVFLNSVLFVGSIYRIRQISNNAELAGRREDGKQRMLQCFKISSWIGASWLFGILPNVINCPELWYIFTICNAFQGVQILMAFGLSKRSRQWLCGETIDSIPEPAFIATTSTNSFSTTVHPNGNSPVTTKWWGLSIPTLQ